VAPSGVEQTAPVPIPIPVLKFPPDDLRPYGRVNLFTRFPWLERFCKSRWFQFALVVPNLAFFWLFLLVGIFGTPVGNRNMIIVFVWILWWVVLIAVMVPFGSRAWCAMCPLPFFGDWIQRRKLVQVRPGKTYGLNNTLFGKGIRWPKQLSNIWIQNLAFLGLATFSVPLVTRPIVSVFVLGSLFVIAAGMALIWRHRTFCNYICPISGFLSLYSMAATVELRQKSGDECLKCRTKNCITGSDKGWACPWGVYMGKLDRNNYCGLCMECVKSCPNNNIALFARPSFTDSRLKGYDEVWKASIMTALAASYSIVLLGPWWSIKNWANPSESGQWGGFAVYAGALWFAALVGLPLLLAGAVWLGRRLGGRQQPFKAMFLQQAYTLVPFGLLAWIAFSVPLLMVNGSYIVSVLSDPAGWGWNLFGTAHVPWTPMYPEWARVVQAGLLLVGFAVAGRKGLGAARDAHRTTGAAVASFLPVLLLLIFLTSIFLRLYTG